MTRDVLCSVLCVTYLLFTANMNFPVTVIGNCFLKRFFMKPSTHFHQDIGKSDMFMPLAV